VTVVLLRGGGGKQRRGAGAGGVRLAAASEERQDILALLARGMGDGHQPLGEQVASITLRPEAALAPQDERTQLALGVVMPRPGLCRSVAGLVLSRHLVAAGEGIGLADAA
jgi:hypothetical protein